jgi:hypothetical protein
MKAVFVESIVFLSQPYTIDQLQANERSPKSTVGSDPVLLNVLPRAGPDVPS